METVNYVQGSNSWHCKLCHQEIPDNVQHACAETVIANFCYVCNPKVNIFQYCPHCGHKL